jgi:hypothetical protein
MERGPEQTPRLENPAKVGYDWFIQASTDSPSSHYGQAARILELARHVGFEDPRPFGDALRRNEDLIRAVRSAALSNHRGVKGAPKIPHQLSDEVIKGVIKTDFDKTTELIMLKTEQLPEIWRDIVRRHSDVEDLEIREYVIRVDVYNMIAESENREDIAA